MKFVSLSAKQKPALDESSFQQLLAAAYVVQKHNDSLRADNPELDTAQVLAEIAEMQSLVLAGELDLIASAKLITDRLLKLVAAAGVSISVVSDGYLDCVAESGMPAKVPGSSLASHSLIATERLKAGETFASDDAQRDMRLDGALCVRLGVGSVVAAPLFRAGEIAGLVEVRWAWANGFRESDIAACKLLAGLATGMLERQVLSTQGLINVAPQQAQAAVAEADSEAIPINEGSSAADPKAAVGEKPEVETVAVSARPSPEMASTTVQSCRVCGRPFGADEAFCGYCSMPRAAAPSSELQSKWASLWFLQRAQDTLQEREQPATSLAVEMPRMIEPDPPAASDPAPDPLSGAPLPDNSHFSYFEPTEAERGAALLELEDLDYVSPLTRAARALRDRLRMKDILLIAVAATLAFGVVSAWPSSGGQLTWFQSMLVRLGWAQTTAHAPAYLGNPEANVWVDAHNVLYYCSGSDLYGKTPEGHFATQREAQQQHFQPDAGLACQ